MHHRFTTTSFHSLGVHSRLLLALVCPHTSEMSRLGFCYSPSQERPWDVTPDKLSLHTLQKVGRAWEQAYQLCIPEKCSTLNWAVWEGEQTGSKHQKPPADRARYRTRYRVVSRREAVLGMWDGRATCVQLWGAAAAAALQCSEGVTAESYIRLPSQTRATEMQSCSAASASGSGFGLVLLIRFLRSGSSLFVCCCRSSLATSDGRRVHPHVPQHAAWCRGASAQTACRLPGAFAGLDVTSTSNNTRHAASWTGSYLVMLSGLHRLQRTDPVLHLLAVLSAEDEPSEGSDDLEGEWETDAERVPVPSLSACGGSESRERAALYLRERMRSPLPQ